MAHVTTPASGDSATTNARPTQKHVTMYTFLEVTALVPTHVPLVRAGVDQFSPRCLARHLRSSSRESCNANADQR
jgi:hypothetical protein